VCVLYGECIVRMHFELIALSYTRHARVFKKLLHTHTHTGCTNMPCEDPLFNRLRLVVFAVDEIEKEPHIQDLSIKGPNSRTAIMRNPSPVLFIFTGPIKHAFREEMREMRGSFTHIDYIILLPYLVFILMKT
jgi:hypothetical protein